MFPSINTAGIQTSLAAAFDGLGSPATFVLYDADSGADPLSLRVAIGRLEAEDLTAGMTQNGIRVRIPAQAWDTASPGRPPRKGDQVTVDGHRYALQEIHPRGLSGVLLMYVCTAIG